ncbi:hypothetical protein, partial [Mangrovimonas sp. TPBH4]|uniref:PKD domain-containing protein n=1 Tax=Mangrovimonas sp. TPBH4 TaxID=1645914 RepID=UPI000A5CB937
MNNNAINSSKNTPNFLIQKLHHKVNIPLVIILTFLFSSSSVSYAQCIESALCADQSVTVDVDALPFCDEGTTGISGDINGSGCEILSDLDNEGSDLLNCYEFVFVRQEQSVTESFTFDVGQGQGCNGELDASYYFYDGINCTPLSSGGSQTTITFDFPDNVNEVYLYLCVNSNANVSICNICRERPPCVLDLTCVGDTDINGNYCDGDPCNLPVAFQNPSDVFVISEDCELEFQMSFEDQGETDCIDLNDDNTISVTRTYTLEYYDPVDDAFYYASECEQSIVLTQENCCVEPNLEVTPGSVCAEGQSSVDLESLVTTDQGALVSFHETLEDAQNNTTELTDTQVSPLEETSFFVRSQVSEDCYTIQELVISINPLPDVNAGLDKILTCSISEVTLDGSSSTPNVSFEWSGPGGYMSTDATPAVSLFLNASGTYTLTVTDENGCTASDTVEVVLGNSAPDVNAGPDKLLTCEVFEVTLEGSSSTPNVSYEWSGPNGFSSSEQNPSISIFDAPGIYTLTVTGENGCTASDTVEVTLDTIQPQVGCPEDMVLCSDDNPVGLSGGTPENGTYSGAGVVEGVFDPSEVSPGIYEITYSYTAANGCSNSCDFMIEVTQEPAPIETIVNICSDEEYLWSVNGETYTTAQDITIEGEDCAADQRLVLTVTPEPAPVVTEVNICSDEEYLWSVNGETYTTAQDITIEGEDCAADQRLVLTVTPEPAPVVTEVNICSDEEYLWSVNGESYTTAQDITIEGEDCAADQRLVLAVTPEPAPVVTEVNICSDEEYLWSVNGESYTTAQDITIEGEDCGADQRLVLTVTPEPAPVVTEVNICSDEEYLWSVNGESYTTAQDITIEGEDCAADQRLVLAVTPEPAPVVTEVNICSDEEYLWSVNGESYTTAQD